MYIYIYIADIHIYIYMYTESLTNSSACLEEVVLLRDRLAIELAHAHAALRQRRSFLTPQVRPPPLYY